MTLTEGLRERFTRVFALVQAFPPPPSEVPTAQYEELNTALGTAMAEAGFPRHETSTGVRYTEREVFRARELTATQRAVAELLATGLRLPLEAYPLPAQGWARRQWLGHSPGVLFAEREDGRTLYEQLRTLGPAEDRQRQEQLEALPLRERLAASADIDLLYQDQPSSMMWHSLGTLCDSIDDTYGEWGRDIIERVSEHNFRTSRFEKFHFITSPLSRLAFIAMVRGGVFLEARFDEVFTLSRWSPLDEQREVLDAIPAERRETALLTGIANAPFPDERVRLALALLPHYPYPSLARHVVAHLDQARNPKDALKQLKQLAPTIPAVAAELAANQGKRAAIPALRVASHELNPAPDTVDSVGRAQLVLSAKRYDGRECTADELLTQTGQDEEPLGPFERLRIDDKKAPAYDAWLYMTDSGTFFRTGTTDIVAEVIQGGVECADLRLRAALIAALADEKKGAKAPASKAKKAKKKPV